MSSAPNPNHRLSPANPAPLLKHHSWSPDSDRDEAWIRRKGHHRAGRRQSRMARSVTDDDLDELRGCIDLGFGFAPDSPDAVVARLSETIPALDLFFSVHRSHRSPAASDSSVSGSPVGSPVSIFSPGDGVEVKKARLKQWAQVVACSVRQNHY